MSWGEVLREEALGVRIEVDLHMQDLGGGDVVAPCLLDDANSIADGDETPTLPEESGALLVKRSHNLFQVILVFGSRRFLDIPYIDFSSSLIFVSVSVHMSEVKGGLFNGLGENLEEPEIPRDKCKTKLKTSTNTQQII